MATLKEIMACLAKDRTALCAFIRDPDAWVAANASHLSEADRDQLLKLGADSLTLLERRSYEALDRSPEARFSAGSPVGRRRFVVTALSAAFAAALGALVLRPSKAAPTVEVYGDQGIDFGCFDDPAGACINNGCGDQEPCVDNRCQNLGPCGDDTGCTDSACHNQGGCMDMANCRDDFCRNCQVDCADSMCSDTNCTNDPACTDNAPCADAACANLTSCVDNGCP